MLPIILLIILFWALIPGLITGWMFKERGKSLAAGLLLGAVCGPAGILAGLVLILISDRQTGRADAPEHARAFRVFYDLPFFGRLHVSTAWALAGVATFACAWMVGGLGYELQQFEGHEARPAQAGGASAGRTQMQRHLTANAPADSVQAEQRAANAAQGNASTQPSGPLLGSLAGQPAQPPRGAAQTGSAAPQPLRPPTPGLNGAVTTAPPTLATGMAEASPTAVAAPAPAAPPSGAQAREAAVAEVTRILGARGHRVHASLSGDARTSTLSLTGATLTRGAGTQLLSSGRTREALKAAGVRIVVLVNGQESWTYML